MSEISYDSSGRVSYDEYLRFLQGSDLGKLYPQRDFKQRVTRVLANCGVSVTARDEDETSNPVRRTTTSAAICLRSILVSLGRAPASAPTFRLSSETAPSFERCCWNS